jgi:hypothetical protein
MTDRSKQLQLIIWGVTSTGDRTAHDEYFTDSIDRAVGAYRLLHPDVVRVIIDVAIPTLRGQPLWPETKGTTSE